MRPRDPGSDEDFRALRRLPAAMPDPVRSEAIRERCRAVLAGERMRTSRHPRVLWRHLIESAIVGAFSLAYLAAVVLDVLKLQRVP